MNEPEVGKTSYWPGLILILLGLVYFAYRTVTATTGGPVDMCGVGIDPY